MIRIYTHVDTWLCPKHNTAILNRRSCDKCVVEQRAALHAAGICATETPLLTTGRAAPEVCDVKYRVNFTSDRLVDVKPDTRYTVNFPSHAIPSYYDLHSTVQAVFGLLDTAHNTTVNSVRLYCQQYAAAANRSPLEKRLAVQNCAAYVWFYLRPSKTSDCIALKEQFVEHFRKLFEDGQRLIVDTSTPLPKKYKLNFNVDVGALRLNATTHELLFKLNACEEKTALQRIEWQQYLDTLKGPTNCSRHANVKMDMVKSLWRDADMPEKKRNNSKLRDQFFDAVLYMYDRGQRVVPVKPSIVDE